LPGSRPAGGGPPRANQQRRPGPCAPADREPRIVHRGSNFQLSGPFLRGRSVRLQTVAASLGPPPIAPKPARPGTRNAGHGLRPPAADSAEASGVPAGHEPTAARSHRHRFHGPGVRQYRPGIFVNHPHAPTWSRRRPHCGPARLNQNGAAWPCSEYPTLCRLKPSAEKIRMAPSSVDAGRNSPRRLRETHNLRVGALPTMTPGGPWGRATGTRRDGAVPKPYPPRRRSTAQVKPSALPWSRPRPHGERPANVVTALRDPGSPRKRSPLPETLDANSPPSRRGDQPSGAGARAGRWGAEKRAAGL